MSATIRITYKLAMAAGQDAGNRNAKAAGRTQWNEEDFAVAAALVAELLEQRES